MLMSSYKYFIYHKRDACGSGGLMASLCSSVSPLVPKQVKSEKLKVKSSGIYSNVALSMILSVIIRVFVPGSGYFGYMPWCLPFK